MLFTKIEPFVRFAEEINYTAVREPSVTCDCRFLYIVDGDGSIAVSGVGSRIMPGLLVCFQPGTRYEFLTQNGFTAVAVDFDYTDEYSTHTAFYPPVPFDGKKGRQEPALHPAVRFDDYGLLNEPLMKEGMFFVDPMLRELCGECGSHRLFSREKASLMFKNILLSVVRHETSESGPSAVTRQVLEYVNANFASGVSNDDIALAFNYNACYLSRLIKAETGTTLHGLMIRRRVEEGIKLLLSTNLSVEAIAVRVGFYNAAHFSSSCRRITGYPPGKYR